MELKEPKVDSSIKEKFSNEIEYMRGLISEIEDDLGNAIDDYNTGEGPEDIRQGIVIMKKHLRELMEKVDELIK